MASDFETFRRLLGPDLADQLERLDELTQIAYEDETDDVRAERHDLYHDLAFGLLATYRQLLKDAPDSVNGGS